MFADVGENGRNEEQTCPEFFSPTLIGYESCVSLLRQQLFYGKKHLGIVFLNIFRNQFFPADLLRMFIYHHPSFQCNLARSH
ncbi:unnamed protein product [Auanema sp. JU1783]|nr:unnamed protein product [Auanema sp. JU1783]